MASDAHGRPSGNAPSFSAPDVKAQTHAERARTLVAGQTTGTLCTIALDPQGYPYGSFATFALHGGRPIFLISRIAEHTRNLAGDQRSSLLVHESGKPDPLANGRVTLVGRAQQLPRETGVEREEVRAAFLAAHPNAGYYVDYTDFDFWRLELEAVRYIGGYGRMSWVDPGDFLRADADPLAPAAARILAHMNQDHADALVRYARAFTRAEGAEKAVMTGIDRYGFDMTVTTPDGVGPARIAFEHPVTSAEQARAALVALARAAS